MSVCNGAQRNPVVKQMVKQTRGGIADCAREPSARSGLGKRVKGQALGPPRSFGLHWTGNVSHPVMGAVFKTAERPKSR